MKKQILFLAFFTLAIIFAGTSKSYGQLLPRTTPAAIDTLVCVANSLPLHPVPGIPYVYRMDGTTGEENTYAWTWWATKDTTFINASGLKTSGSLSAPSDGLMFTGANYLNSVVDADSVVITWSPEVLANTDYEGTPDPTGATPSPTFVVAYANGINCADNIEVYEINPVPAFTVDIANITEDGTVLDWDVDTAECVDIVRSATYRNALLEMDYGTDTLYFEIVASNFVTSWTPYFSILGGLNGSQTADLLISLDYAAAQAGTPITGTTELTGLTAGQHGWGDDIELTAATASEVPNGVKLVARVIIHNNTYESLTSSNFNLAVDGQDFTNQWDMEDTDCSDPTTAVRNEIDEAVQIIRPRPTIEGTPDLGGTTIDTDTPAVDPEDVIEKERN